MRGLCLALLIMTATTAAYAVDLSTAQQDRANALFKQIRCPTCTAQPVSESDASLSIILRNRIEQSIADGQTDEQILHDLTNTYGDDIRLMPKAETRTMPLWLAPWVIILLGGLGIIINHRRKQRQ